jgi:hypothetical protein
MPHDTVGSKFATKIRMEHARRERGWRAEARKPGAWQQLDEHVLDPAVARNEDDLRQVIGAQAVQLKPDREVARVARSRLCPGGDRRKRSDQQQCIRSVSPQDTLPLEVRRGRRDPRPSEGCFKLGGRHGRNRCSPREPNATAGTPRGYDECF